MALATDDDGVQALWENAVAPSTLKHYERGFKSYCQFVASLGMPVTSENDLPPVTVELLCKFIATCHKRGLLSQTINTYLCGIKFMCMRHNHSNCSVFTDPVFTQKCSYLLKSVKRSQTKGVSRKLPITFDILQKMCTAFSSGLFDPYTNVLMTCACTVAFFGFLRLGEFCIVKPFCESKHLTYSDIKLSASVVVVNLKKSKTDVHNVGTSVTLHSTLNQVCPVAAVKKYVDTRRVFHRTQCDDKTAFYLDREGNPLSRSCFLNKLITTLRHIGISNVHEYSGHSFRRGACTTASTRKIDQYVIKKLGRWSSSCFERYIDMRDTTIRDAQRALANEKVH